MNIERTRYIKRLFAYSNNGRVKIVTGPRRSGKTYLLKELFKSELLARGVKEDHFLYLSFEGSDNLELRNPLKLEEYVKSLLRDGENYYLVIDEPQNILSILNPALTNGELVLAKKDDPNAIGYVQVALSLMKIANLDIYISGSNSRFLSKDILTDFRDRGDEIRVLPLSFSEFVSLKGDDHERLYEEYSLYGGMPLILSYESDEEKEKYLKNLYLLTYQKDIAERHKVKDEDALNDLAAVLASSIGSLSNSSKIALTYNSKGKKTNDAFVGECLSYFEEAYIIQKAERYDIRGRKKIGALCKYYFTDVGIRNSLLDFLSPDYGHVMENIIYNELIYRGYSVEVGIINAFSKENGVSKRNTYETDFLIRKGSRRYYIQSCYSLLGEETYERESKPLRLIHDSFKKIIVTRKGGPIRRDAYGITQMGIVDFLLNEDSLDL